MATYRLSVNIISRSRGRSSVAASAYRAGEKMFDKRLEQSFNYKNKKDINHKEILAPDNAPNWVSEREKLWNAVEKSEKRKDAQVSREIQLSLPKEFTQAQNISLAQTFVKKEFVERGMIADVALHNLEKDNPHAHIMLTTREITTQGFGPKARSWNKKELLLGWRKSWETHLNYELKKAGIEQEVDCRSYEAQNIKLESQHIGSAAFHMHERGEENLSEIEKLKEIQYANGQRIINNPQVALDALTRQSATFSQHDLERFINSHTLDQEQFDRAYILTKTCPELVSIGHDEQGRARYTSQAMINTERSMLLSAKALSKPGHAVKRGIVTQTLSQNPTMSPEQRQCLGHLLDNGDLKCLVGVSTTRLIDPPDHHFIDPLLPAFSSLVFYLT